VKNYPDPRSKELDQLCSFAVTNTPKDAVFLFPDGGESLHPGIFRVQTLRPVYVDWKSGGQVNYYRSVAEEWWMRWQATMTKTADGRALTPADLDDFAHLGIQYAVVSPAHSIAAVLPAYRNAKFVAYRLRDRNSSTSRARRNGNLRPRSGYRYARRRIREVQGICHRLSLSECHGESGVERIAGCGGVFHGYRKSPGCISRASPSL